MPVVLKNLNPSGTPSIFPTQQPILVPTLTAAALTSKKTFHIPSSGPSDHSS